MHIHSSIHAMLIFCHFLVRFFRGLKNVLYNRAGAECNGANTFFSVKDSGVLRFFQSNKTGF